MPGDAVISRSLFDFSHQLSVPPKHSGSVYPLDLSCERRPRAVGGDLPRPGYRPVSRPGSASASTLRVLVVPTRRAAEHKRNGHSQGDLLESALRAQLLPAEYAGAKE